MKSHGASGRILGVLAVCLTAACGGGGYGGGGDSAPPASISLAIDPVTITLGQTATLTWNTNGANCTAGGAWSGTKAPSGTESVTPTATGTFTYSLSCFGGGYRESEGRSVTLTVNPSGGMSATLLVAGFAGSSALTTDPRLVRPRAIAVGRGAAVQVAGLSTPLAYDGDGNAAEPPGEGSVHPTTATSGTMDLTGMVANADRRFVISAGGESGPAEFIFAGKGGIIGGWSGEVGHGAAVIAHSATDGAVYTGLTMADDEGAVLLYAADFRNGKVDVFDSTFAKQPTGADRFAFEDATLPAGFAPFGIQAVERRPAMRTEIYVTYARQGAADTGDPASEAGLGLVNAFDTGGRLLRRLVAAGGALAAPWGIALAPAGFGTLGGGLLVGNAGDGRIVAFDADTGRLIGLVSDADGRPIATPGLRGIAFGNDSHSQPRGTLFFTASTDDTDGVFGRIDVGVMPHAPQLDD